MWSNFPTDHCVPAAQSNSTPVVLAPSPTAAAALQGCCFQPGEQENIPRENGTQQCTGTSQDSCTHSMWECWCCTDGAQAEEHKEPGSRVHPAGNAAARSSAHVSNAGERRDFHILLTITHIKSKQLKAIRRVTSNAFQQLSSVSHVDISTS